MQITVLKKLFIYFYLILKFHLNYFRSKNQVGSEMATNSSEDLTFRRPEALEVLIRTPPRPLSKPTSTNWIWIFEKFRTLFNNFVLPVSLLPLSRSLSFTFCLARLEKIKYEKVQKNWHFSERRRWLEKIQNVCWMLSRDRSRWLSRKNREVKAESRVSTESSSKTTRVFGK